MYRALLPWLCTLSLVVGCAGTRSQPTADGNGNESGGERETGDETEGVATSGGQEHTNEADTTRSPGACPSSFGDQSPTCTADDFPSDCAYPEGTCGCRQPTYCGGAAPPPMPRTWICEATPVPCPAAGTPCSGPGRCSNQACGWQGVACEGGVWTPYIQSPPP